MSLFWARMLAIDTHTFILVVLICGWGFLIMRSMVSQPMLALISYPLMVANSIVAHTYLSDSYFILSMDRGYGVALTTGVGMIGTLLVLVLLVRLCLLIMDHTGRQPELLERRGPAAPKTQLR